MDITFENNDFIFNFRVAIVIRKGNKILVQKDDRVKHLTLPGGRCMLGENTFETSIREFEEETGIKCNFKKNIGIIENFFTSSFNGKKYHEILMVNEIVFSDKHDYNKIITPIEEKKKDHLSFIWEDINELDEKVFKPDVIIEMLNNNEIKHYIVND